MSTWPGDTASPSWRQAAAEGPATICTSVSHMQLPQVHSSDHATRRRSGKCSSVGSAPSRSRPRSAERQRGKPRRAKRSRTIEHRGDGKAGLIAPTEFAGVCRAAQSAATACSGAFRAQQSRSTYSQSPDMLMPATKYATNDHHSNSN